MIHKRSKLQVDKYENNWIEKDNNILNLRLILLQSYSYEIASERHSRVETTNPSWKRIQ